MLLGWQEGQRARHSLKVAEEHDRLTIQQMKGQEEVALGTVPAGTPFPVEIARAAEKSFVVLELDADEVISRRMTVPAQARDLLPGIVRNQIERLSPWRASQAAYGFDVRAGADATSLDVRVLITSRAQLEDACSRLGALGLRIDRVVAGKRLADAAAPVTLWSRLADASGNSLARARWMIGGLIAATLCLTMSVSVWAFMTAASADGESDDVAARVAALQRQVRGTLPQQSIAALAPPERAWALKETSPVAVVVVEALSRSLPDTSYLTELNLDGATLRLVGLADDAPSLIALLEQSGHLKDVRFFAPTTRGADGRRFVFHIEARVEPHMKVEGG
ncbi:PilN domain-containing protein [Bradyrhizobium prioriisuperbiae]|uniref:PilN domain-containing protein n=1 Tax=Bradyrhizobium prioriisuperbiae TaxID=2854389 RepID=UPI0028EB9D62|nr:PilN domain-containing protein [Bradyrhizobium prioritasuperba]